MPTTNLPEVAGLLVSPVFARDGSIILFDIWYNDVWRGSRRTLHQCHMIARQRLLTWEMGGASK